MNLKLIKSIVLATQNGYTVFDISNSSAPGYVCVFLTDDQSDLDWSRFKSNLQASNSGHTYILAMYHVVTESFSSVTLSSNKVKTNFHFFNRWYASRTNQCTRGNLIFKINAEELKKLGSAAPLVSAMIDVEFTA